MRDKLVSFCNVVRGVSYSPHDLRDSYNNNRYYLLRSNNIKKGKLIFQDMQIVDDNCVSPSQKLEKFDIAVCMSNGSKRLVGKSAQFKGDTTNFCVGAFCAGFRPHINAEPNYIYQLFQSQEYQKYIDITLAGSAINNLKGSDVLNFEFNFPPLPQQKKIAKILSTVDNVIKQTESAIAKYQAIKQGLMHDLFTRGIDVNTGKLRPTPQEAPELYKESALGLIPMDWSLKKFSEILDITTGNKDTQDRVDNGKYPFYVRSQKVERINSFSFDGIGILTAGDGVGTGKVFHFVNGKIAIHQRVYLLYNFKTDIIPEYVYEYFKLNFIHRVEKYSAKNTVDSVRLEMISEMLIPISEEQEKISKILININDKIQTEQQALAKYQQLKAGLLQDLLTGKVEVSED